MGLFRAEGCTDHVKLELFLIPNGRFSWLINKISSDCDLALYRNDNGEKMIETDILFPLLLLLKPKVFPHKAIILSHFHTLGRIIFPFISTYE